MVASADEVAAFLARLPEPGRDQLSRDPALPERLGRLWQSARAAWPDLPLSSLRFYGYLGERLSSTSALDQALERTRAADLYLCCACLDGVKNAVESFEAHPFREAAASLRQLNAPADTVEDAKQIARQILLSSKGERRAALAEYAGRGDLRSWLRVILTRELLRLLGDVRELRLDTGELANAVGAQHDPETEYLRSLYQDQFKAAFAEAMTQLSAHERRLLRYHFVERLSIDEVGVLLRMHRATAARQLVRVRASLLERTRQVMASRLRVDDAELQSILRLIESQLEVSLQRLLT
jgi:RNA polymerase sigma-70 factor (ECF subfamily)